MYQDVKNDEFLLVRTWAVATVVDVIFHLTFQK